MAAIDATKEIQNMVDIAIGDDLKRFGAKDKIALNYILEGNAFFIKILGFRNENRNCIHVKIEEDIKGNPVYKGRAVNFFTVADPLVPFEV